jgi:hypothetical protein
MNRKTITALLVFVLLLGLVYFLQHRPEKGERRGERPKPLPRITVSAAKQISITSKGTTVVLVRGDKDTWTLTKPVGYPADKYAVDSMTEKLGKLEFGDLVTELKGKHPEYEVDDKSGVHVTASDGQKTVADFYLGKVIDDFTMLRPAGKDQVYQAVGSLRFVFDREVKNWRKRTIVELKQEEVRGLEVAAFDQNIALTRADEKSPWKVKSTSEKGELGALDEATVRNLLSSFCGLSAFDFADGVTPEKSGLDKPTAKITAISKDGAPTTLVVGGKKDDDYWVRRQDAPQIFVLKKYNLENLLKRPIDFRDKTVLSFKAADVVTLSVDQKKDKQLMRLTPKGAEWLVDGKPVKDAGKIKTALDALAALKADGFGAHSAADYGLDKPDWVVEIQLKDRTKHVLTIGSVEKDGVFGLTRKGATEIFTLRKYTLDRFLLDPKNYKK